MAWWKLLIFLHVLGIVAFAPLVVLKHWADKREEGRFLRANIVIDAELQINKRSAKQSETKFKESFQDNRLLQSAIRRKVYAQMGLNRRTFGDWLDGLSGVLSFIYLIFAAAVMWKFAIW